MSVAPFTTFSLVKHIDGDKLALFTTGYDHLGNAFPIINDKVILRQVNQYHTYFTTIVGINAYLMKQFGPDALVQMMRQMGIYSFLDPVNSLCVGAADISVYEMVAAYNTFPSKGVYVTPMFVTRIEDNQGNLLSEFTNKKREAISDQTAYLMATMMQGVVNGGTASRLRNRYGLTGQIAGKTGTTNDNSDGWFIGYTPTITAGAWVGCEDRQVHFNSTALGQGSNAALPIWALWMKKVLKDGSLGISESDRFIAPAEMTVSGDCSSVGDSASGSNSETEYYFE